MIRSKLWVCKHVFDISSKDEDEENKGKVFQFQNMSKSARKEFGKYIRSTRQWGQLGQSIAVMSGNLLTSLTGPFVGHAVVNSLCPCFQSWKMQKSINRKLLMRAFQCFRSQVSGRNLPNLPDNLSVGRQADVVTLFSPQDFSICHSGFLRAVTLVLWLWIQIKFVNWRCWFQRAGIAGC